MTWHGWVVAGVVYLSVGVAIVRTFADLLAGGVDDAEEDAFLMFCLVLWPLVVAIAALWAACRVLLVLIGRR